MMRSGTNSRRHFSAMTASEMMLVGADSVRMTPLLNPTLEDTPARTTPVKQPSPAPTKTTQKPKPIVAAVTVTKT